MHIIVEAICSSSHATKQLTNNQPKEDRASNSKIQHDFCIQYTQFW